MRSPVDPSPGSGRWRDRRHLTALAIALTADAVQIGLLPFFMEGAAAPWNDALDVTVGAVLIALLGWHVAFLPAFLGELVPLLNLFPTWTAAVVFVVTRKKMMLLRVIAVAVVIGSMMVAHTEGSQAAAGARPVNSGTSRRGGPELKSNVALVFDPERGEALYAKHPTQVAPIASITKLMTAMVVLDAQSPLDETIEIDRADVDTRRHTRSRLPVGARLGRGELLMLALMASENRAATALARTHPGGTAACLEAMNRKAKELGMLRTRFTDPAGLSGENVSSAEDLSRMVLAAMAYPEIREATTTLVHAVTLADGRVLEFHNSDGLVSNKTWKIGLSKTGFIHEAGQCLVLHAEIAARQIVIVLLNSWGKYTRLGDANRIRKWMEATVPPPATGREVIPIAPPAPARGAQTRP